LCLIWKSLSKKFTTISVTGLQLNKALLQHVPRNTYFGRTPN
jgi:hypothetical protein